MKENRLSEGTQRFAVFISGHQEPGLTDQGLISVPSDTKNVPQEVTILPPSAQEERSLAEILRSALL